MSPEKTSPPPVGSTPAAFGEFVRREMDKYARIAREANIPKQ